MTSNINTVIMTGTKDQHTIGIQLLILLTFLKLDTLSTIPLIVPQGMKNVDIKDEVYSFRARFQTIWGYEGDWIDNMIYSDYSNIVEIGNPAYWSTASDWATPELKKQKTKDLYLRFSRVQT